MMKKSIRFGSACRAAVILGLGLTLALLPKGVRAATSCPGDCNGNGTVTSDELLDVVDIALGDADLSTCMAADSSTPPDGKVTVDDALRAVDAAVNGCNPTPVCGNGKKEGDEECDNGGTCLGGSNAGTHCTAETDCHGDGVCQLGLKAGTPCSSTADCPGGTCQHCIPQGGDDCAANCTLETDIPFHLQPGVPTADGSSIEPGTSGAVVHGQLQIPLPLTGSQTFTVGRERNGQIPMIVKAASVMFPQIDVQGLACACVRGVAAKTCGGTAFAKTGGSATDCTPGFSNGGDTAHDGPCPADLPCAFVHGDGNSADGVIACGSTGLQGINLAFMQDDANAATSCTTAANCASLPSSPQCVSDGAGSMVCGPTPSSLVLSGTGGMGDGLVLNSTAIGQAVGACTPNFCTDADPFSVRGTIATLPLTTGQATGLFTSVNGVPDSSVCACSDPNAFICATSDGNHCTGPLVASGQTADCAKLEVGNLSGASLALTFTSSHIPIVGDSVITTVFFGM